MVNKVTHVAIIPDGNRRWAKENGLGVSGGHYKSASYDNIKGLLNEAKSLGIRYLSVWGFSTENWNRDQAEIKEIFKVVGDIVNRFSKEAKENNIKFIHMGRKDRLPKELVDSLTKLENETKNFVDFQAILCLDYGGRDEIVRAVNEIIRKGVRKIDEKEFSSYLDSKDIPDPDLIIRTSGEKRLSGFMPFQGAYSELYFTDVYFPEFDALELRKAVEEYNNRQRRYGK